MAHSPKFIFKLCSIGEGVTLLFVVFLLSTLAHRDTESASVDTLLIVFAFVVPRKAESWGVVVGTVNVVVGLLWVVDIAF